MTAFSLSSTRAIEHGEQLGLLLPAGQARLGRPVDVGDRGDPRRAKLARPASSESEREEKQNSVRKAS